MNDQDYMWLAVVKTRAGIAAGQTPFGACIVNSVGQVVSCAHNSVWASTDITAHAEIQAIRMACLTQGSVRLEGCTIYSTCEPCPMCFAACHWAGIERIVYGASIDDAQKAGFNELAISDEMMKRLGGSDVDLAGGILRDECVALFAEWRDRALSLPY